MKYMVLPNRKVELEIYKTCKYDIKTPQDFEEDGITRYTYPKGRVSDWEVKEISPEEIYNMGYDDTDPHNEYLILTVDGEESIFRNSFVDMFMMA